MCGCKRNPLRPAGWAGLILAGNTLEGETCEDPRPSKCSREVCADTGLRCHVSHGFVPLAQFEFMIESILYARDAWLKEDGIIWPTTAALHLVPCSADKDYRSKVLFWDNAYEFNLSALK